MGSLNMHPSMSSLMIKTSAVIVLISLFGLNVVDGQNVKGRPAVEYLARSCRKHTALLTDFGGVGDGKTSNTKAFKDAITKLSSLAADGGAQLVVPPGNWLTGAFNLTSNFTLFIDKSATILASQDEREYPILPPMPSYGIPEDGPGGRHNSLIFASNLTDVIITGNNGTINGQGPPWWKRFRDNQLTITRPYLIQIMYSERVQLSNITLVDSPHWNVHPVYSRDVLIQGLTILSQVGSPNTDGIDPDSSTNVRIEDCFIVSGDDCIAVKSGLDQYGIDVGMPTQQLVIRRLTCISPRSAAVALGSEMSGGIKDVRIEDLTALDTESGIRIKTATGRGGYVKDIFARRMTMKTMKYGFWMTGAYTSHARKFDLKAQPQITNINYRDTVAENVTYTAKLDGIPNNPFTGICLSNINMSLTANPKELQWNCTDVSGVASKVTPPPCNSFAAKNPPVDCPFPEDKLPIDSVVLQKCST